MQVERSLNEIYKFPVYGTREDYFEAFGVYPPEWNPKEAPKFWFDPKALENPRREIFYDVLELDEFDRPWKDENNKPSVISRPVQKKIAATVNIPPNQANYPGSGQSPVPVPLDLSKIGENESLEFNKVGVVVVRDNEKYDQLNDAGVYTIKDRARDNKIAEDVAELKRIFLTYYPSK